MENEPFRNYLVEKNPRRARASTEKNFLNLNSCMYYIIVNRECKYTAVTREKYEVTLEQILHMHSPTGKRFMEKLDNNRSEEVLDNRKRVSHLVGYSGLL